MVLVIINAAYIFHSGPLTETDLEWVATSFPSSQTAVLTSVRVLRFLIPTDFLMGVYWQLHHSNQGHPASLLGMYNRMGWWYYYPVAFLLKTTIPFLLVSLVALGWAVYGVLWKGKRSLLVLLLPFGLYSILMMLSPIDIGIRYFLPAYPFLFILSGGMLIALLQRPFQTSARIISRVIVVIAFAWMTFEAVSTYPNYIPYMTAQAFVDKLDNNTGNVLSTSDKSNLVQMLTGNPSDTTRANVVRQVAENANLDQREFRKAFVLMQYFGYLRRNPNDAPDGNFAGFDFWLKKLNDFNGDFLQAEMVKAFLSSIEYNNRL